MQTGIVLEGGAMRGMFTAGVLDVIMESGLTADGAIGVSAGAAFGCNLKSGQIGRALRYNLKYSRDRRYCSLYSLLRTGNLYGGEFCYHELPERLDVFDRKAFEENPMAFYVVCTDVTTGKPIYHRCETVDWACQEWFRASASLPLVSRVVEVDGFQMLDGGLSDPIPLRYFEQLGYEKNLVVLTRPADYRKTPSNLMPLLRLNLRRYPKLLQTMQMRHQVYNETLAYVEKQERAGSALVIRPTEALPVNRIERDPKVLKQVYDLGRAEAEAKLLEIRAFLK